MSQLKIKPSVGAARALTTEERNQVVADLGLDSVEPRLEALEGGTTAIRAVDDVGLGLEDTVLTGNVLTNDSAETGSLSVTMFTVNGVAGVFNAGQTANISGIGTITISGTGTYTFTPVTAYNGAVPDVTYQVTNGTTLASARLRITVGAVANAPIAVDDAPAAGIVNTTLTFNPTTNDNSPDGGTLQITRVNGVAVTAGGGAVTMLNAQVSLLANNVLSVVPNTDYSGTFNFNYTITDSSNSLTATATCVVTFADPEADGITYYVDASAANDGGDGSAGNPKKYIQSGAALMSPFGGDTLIIKPGTYSNASDRVNGLKSGTSARWNIIRAQTDGTVRITAGCYMPLTEDDQPIAHYLQIEGLTFDDNISKGVTGSHIKFLRCFFRGGPLTDNTNNMGCGTNDHIPGAEYILFEDCLFYGVGGRYTALSYDSDKVIFRRCVFRHSAGWSDIKGDPQGCLSVYNNVNSHLQNCIAIDTPAMTNLEAAFFWPSNNRTSSNCSAYGCIMINIAAAGMSWDDYAEATNMTATHCVAIDCGAPFVGNGGAKAILLDRCTAVNGLGSTIRGYGNALMQVRNSIVSGMANGDNIGGTSLNGTSNYYNPTVVGEGSLNPATNGLLYPVRLESGSALATLNRGAVVTKRMGVSGTLYGETGWNTLTSENLWPWPDEARIKAALQADDPRGFCVVGLKGLDGVSDMTLSRYVWEKLGNQIPAEVYAPAAPSVVTAPTISGQFVRGGVLSVNVGAWTNSPDSYNYYWTRNGSDISGATSSTYTCQVADVGTTVACRVTATNGTGTSASSTATGSTVIAATAPGTVTPTVTGDLFVGGTLTCNPGSVSGLPSPTFSYQWKRGATNVGTNSVTYVAEATGSHTCTVTATNIAGSNSGTSASVTVGGLTTKGDTFVEASPPVNLQSHTTTGPNGGSAWSKLAGFSGTDLQVIAGGQVQATGGSAANFQPYLLSDVPASGDQNFVTTLTFSSTGRTSLAIGLRLSADGSTGYWAWQSGGTWVIYKRTGGSWVLLASAGETSGGSFAVEFVVRDGSQKLYKAGALLCQAEDTEFASGRVGIAPFYSEPVSTNTMGPITVTWPG